MPDYLSCGGCCKDFELNKIEDFIQHKQKECLLTLITSNILICKQCLKTFRTPLSLLWHLQLDHGVQLIDLLPQRKISVSSSETQIEVLSIDSKDVLNNTVIETTTPYKQIQNDDKVDFIDQSNYIVSNLDSQSETSTYLPFPRVSNDPPNNEINNESADNHSKNRNATENRNLFENTTNRSKCSKSGCILDGNGDSRCAGRRLTNSITCALDGSTTSKCCLEMDSELMDIGNTNDTDLDNTQTEEIHLQMDMSQMMSCSSLNDAGDQQLSSSNVSVINPSNFLSNMSTPLYSNIFTASPGLSETSSPNLTSEKRFLCDICGKTFRQKIHLSKHFIQSHSQSSAKPYKCDECSYSTVEKSHLTIHKRLHTGEKPFKCRVCGYGARQNCTLKHHYIKRHPNSKVLCSNCNSKFFTDVELSRHKKNCSSDENPK